MYLYDGKLIDRKGTVKRQWKCRYLGIIHKKHYIAQLGYEEPLWGMYTLGDKPVWEKKEAIHHDIVITPQNTIITFIKECHEYKGRKVDFDIIVEYDMEGKELQRWSSWDNLKYLQSFHAKLELDLPRKWYLPELVKSKPTTPWGGNYDYYRLNSIQVLPATALGRRDPRFAEGNWLISFRHGSMIFILDKQKKVVWKAVGKDIKGNIEGQHAVQLLKNGRMLIFDNGRYRGWSRIIEIDPVTYKVVWEYKGKDFFTRSQGYVQKLKTGNYLITESEKGHAFEITPKGKIVWEFFHPETQDKNNAPLHPESWGKRQWIYRMIAY